MTEQTMTPADENCQPPPSDFQKTPPFEPSRKGKRTSAAADKRAAKKRKNRRKRHG